MICLPDSFEKPKDCLHCWIPCDINNYNKCPVIEIVRCKDCKYWDKSWISRYENENYHYCILIDGTQKEDFYCAYGERRKEE